MSAHDFILKYRNSVRPRHLFLAAIGLVGVFIMVILISGLGFLLVRTGLGKSFLRFGNWLFALDSVQIWWYVTRAAGLVAYLLLWLSTAWGLAVSSKIFDPMLKRNYTYDFHQFLSLLAIGFTFLHVAVLGLDRYLPFSALQILIPFTASYRPFWVGIGIISLYLSLLVTVTFYLRRFIGQRAFRLIHTASLIAYFGATFHGLFAGTDSSLLSAHFLYQGSALSIIFLLAYWLITLVQGSFTGIRQSS